MLIILNPYSYFFKIVVQIFALLASCLQAQISDITSLSYLFLLNYFTMVIICECGDLVNILIPRNAHLRSKVWDACMKESEGHLGQVEFDQIIKEVYDDIFHLVGEIDSESSSSGFMDIMTEMNESFIDK